MRAKVIHKSNGSVKLEKTKHIYELNTISGLVKRAELIFLDKHKGWHSFKLVENKNCMYVPADSMEIAKETFDIILSGAKSGTIKLSNKEWIAKWWAVLTIKFRRLCRVIS